MTTTSSSDISAFHETVAELDYPMIVVTVPGSGCLVGFSTQCSIDPPRYLVLISKKNHTHEAARRASAMAVHVLDEADRHLAEVFGQLTGDVVDKLSLVSWSEGPEGVPILDGSAAWFAGRVLDRFDGGDHTGFVLEPVAAERRRPITQLGFQGVKDLDPGHDP
ncbi:MAG TPA: flavin reductase family protein [Acidimicrobiales bacterium]|nr:flavin reductase family protein [Acidimicrobiales bacterium]